MGRAEAEAREALGEDRMAQPREGRGKEKGDKIDLEDLNQEALGDRQDVGVEVEVLEDLGGGRHLVSAGDKIAKPRALRLRRARKFQFPGKEHLRETVARVFKAGENSGTVVAEVSGQVSALLQTMIADGQSLTYMRAKVLEAGGPNVELALSILEKEVGKVRGRVPVSLSSLRQPLSRLGGRRRNQALIGEVALFEQALERRWGSEESHVEPFEVVAALAEIVESGGATHDSLALAWVVVFVLEMVFGHENLPEQVRSQFLPRYDEIRAELKPSQNREALMRGARALVVSERSRGDIVRDLESVGAWLKGEDAAD